MDCLRIASTGFQSFSISFSNCPVLSLSVTGKRYVGSMKQTTSDDLTTDALEQRLIELESFVSRIRSEQISLLREADRRQMPMADGCRSLQEWVAGRLDVGPETARVLVSAGRILDDQAGLESALRGGEASFDRVVATASLVAAGADQGRVELAAGLDIPGIRRLASMHRRMAKSDEQSVFAERFLSMQPTLDHSSFRLWGQLPGADGQLVQQALLDRGDLFPALPDASSNPLGQRNADALVSIAQDSLTGTSGEETGASGPVLSVFTDGSLAAPSDGEAGSVTSGGVKVGAATVEEIFCGGSVEHTVIFDGRPLAVGRSARQIPPRLRRFVLFRDGGCCADGCTSRYRLQPHHRIPWSEGGPTDPENLVSLCWFHHHVVVHQMAHVIRPSSPSDRLRFNPPGHDPP